MPGRPVLHWESRIRQRFWFTMEVGLPDFMDRVYHHTVGIAGLFQKTQMALTTHQLLHVYTFVFPSAWQMCLQPQFQQGQVP